MSLRFKIFSTFVFILLIGNIESIQLLSKIQNHDSTTLHNGRILKTKIINNIEKNNKKNIQEKKISKKIKRKSERKLMQRRLKKMNIDEKADDFIGSFKKTMSITRKTIQNIKKQLSSIEKDQNRMKKKLDKDIKAEKLNGMGSDMNSLTDSINSIKV